MYTHVREGIYRKPSYHKSRKIGDRRQPPLNIASKYDVTVSFRIQFVIHLHLPILISLRRLGNVYK